MINKSKYLVQIGTIPASEGVYIQVTTDGPYKVFGISKLIQVYIEPNASKNSGRYAVGRKFEARNEMSLCRCGHSKNAPFCDGAHVTAVVDLAEKASFLPLLQGSKEITGPKQILTDNEDYCAFTRFCDNGNRVWSEVQMAGEKHERLTEFMVHSCAGGRLLVIDRETMRPIENSEDPGIYAIEDLYMKCSGPLMVRGGIRVESAAGQSYEIRNRQALCRCGQSANKPFCDSSHAAVKYQDGIK